ncbi:hypothetical protein NC315_38195 [Streptomyces sp. G2]|uniref:hypothetical protein n=1 Tax=Streptomyces sp. G2 TaxID=1684471 RepID=UPI00202E4B40|nr:hypothetical protein [Streptomyces sp. G2]MCM1951141.1 hypothetical protein [Streptomyces sp. G2]
MGAGALVLGGLGAWLASVTGERPENEPYAPQALEEALWPGAWPATVRMPFRGSKAAAWKSGIEGMPLPEAKAGPGLTKAQVYAGLDSVHDFLVDTNLSEDTLTGATPAQALALTADDDPARRLLDQTLTHPGENPDPLHLVTRFDPDDVRVHGSPRTEGTMTYQVVAGQLRVKADYTFVYAVTKTSGGRQILPDSLEATRVVVRRSLELTVHHGKVRPLAYKVAIGNNDCTHPDDGFIHPLFSDDTSKTKAWPRTDPYTQHPSTADTNPCHQPTHT